MYTGDKRKRITVRMNDELFDFIQTAAETMGVSPADFVRMSLNTLMTTVHDFIAINARMPGQAERTDSGRGNDEADINDKL